jgi:hypothetical protein
LGIADDNDTMRIKRLLWGLGFLIIFLQPLLALSLPEWIILSDRSMNGEIVEMIKSTDYETALSIAEALGTRQDPYLADIIMAIFNTHHGKDSAKYEYLLEVMLHSLFNLKLSDGELKNRYELNKGALNQLITNMPYVESPDLKKELIQIIPLILACEMEALISILKKEKGYLEKSQDQELLTLLWAMQRLALPDFIDLCNTVACLSSNKDVVKLARQAAGHLLKQ